MSKFPYTLQDSFVASAQIYKGCSPPTILCIDNGCKNKDCSFDRDVDLVVEQTLVSRQDAADALLKNEGDIVNAILSIDE